MRFSISFLLSAALVVPSANALQPPSTVNPAATTGGGPKQKQPVSMLEDWQLLDNGSVIGTVKGNPAYNDGDVITTSPLSNPAGATKASFVTSLTGSEYLLGTPRFQTSRGAGNGGNTDIVSNGEVSRDQFVNQFLQVSGLVSLIGGAAALGVNMGGSAGNSLVSTTSPPVAISTASPADMTGRSIQSPPDAWTKSTPSLVDEPTGEVLSPQEVRDLFKLWNNALTTGNPDTVAMRYAKEAVLLPTKSDIPRSDYDGIRDYFVHFLEKKPNGRILESYGT